MPMHSEYSVFLVLFPMLTEFHCKNYPYLSPYPKLILFLTSWIYIYIYFTEDPQVGLLLIFL